MTHHQAPAAGMRPAALILAGFLAFAALKPPAGNANPSRACEQELHTTLDMLGPGLCCRPQ